VEHGEQPAGRPWGATAKARPPSPSVFWQVRGGWSAIVSGRWAPGERVAGRIQIKAKLFPSSPLHDRGKKMNSVVQNDTVLLFPIFIFFCFFFSMYETASFWIKRAVSFKCGAKTR
jgi:hypothetical protein